MARTSYMPLPQRESRRSEDNTSFALPHHENLSTSSLHFLSRRVRTTAATLHGVLAPSFLHRSPRNARPADIQASRVPSSTLSTDWLDGLRGVASFVVFLFHHAVWSHPSIRWGYGAKEGATSFFHLPIVCLILHGRSMVAVFFVISGYALSFSTLQSIHKKDHDKLFTRLSSSVFRRAIRLYLPSVVSASFHYMAQRFGIKQRKEHVSTFTSDTTDFLVEITSRLSPFSWTAVPIEAFYNEHLWTIPVEFRNSLVLFVTLLGLSRTKCSVRMLTITGLFFYCLVERQWDTALFMAGIVLAEANILQERYGERAFIMGDDVEKGRVEFAISPKTIQVAVNAGLRIRYLALLYVDA
ncbi:acyltransferase family-domain-containing protein [Fusarium flagelliforme]|uniref:Acyltransferase family-domain-containing protein n=1 Tax=Fusarium flagelliforme TaxID=2675880 RepID=A0A395MJ09_9HYPO|nr:acyltransferase family-domain-containing protein [Fusarium flagelliforme]